MFGAYQVGAWKVLSRHFAPEMVVGVSIGSLNAWMIAGGCSPEQLERHWLEGEEFSTYEWRLPRSWRQGLVHPGNAHAVMQRMHRELKNVLPLGIVARRGATLQPVLFRGSEITWRHLAASCAIPLVFDLQVLDGVTYVDGGLLDPLPLFAARQMGATKILGLNCMTWGGFGGGGDAIHLRPKRRLGLTPMAALCWDRERTERWIAEGEADAQALVESGGMREV